MKCFKKIIAFKQQITVGGNRCNATQECKNLALAELMHLSEQGLGSRREHGRCGKCFSVQDGATWFKGNVFIHLYS